MDGISSMFGSVSDAFRGATQPDYQPGYLAPGLPGGLMLPEWEEQYAEPAYPAGPFDDMLVGPGGLVEPELEYQPGYLAPGLPGGLLPPDFDPMAAYGAFGHYSD